MTLALPDKKHAAIAPMTAKATAVKHSALSRVRWGALAILVVLAAGLTGCSDKVEASEGATGPAAVGAPPRQVLVILLDAARPDRMSCYGYERETTPNVDALAAEGAVFLRNYAQGQSTRVSLPNMLFSRVFSIPLFPFSSEVPLSKPIDLFRAMDAESASMAKVFEANGFHTAGISAHTWIRSDTRFAQEFVEWHDLSTELGREGFYPYPRAPRVIDYAQEWIAEHKDEDFFLYLHLMDTHFPHRFEKDAKQFLGKPPAAKRRFDANGRPKAFFANQYAELSADERAYLDAIYDGGMRYTDRELGRLFKTLEEETSLLDDGLLAIISDHGEALLERPDEFEHGGEWTDRVGRVPFILVGRDRVPAGRHEYFTGMIDLLPTLAGCMGLELPPKCKPDGIDLSPYLTGELPDRDYMLTDSGLVRGGFKATFARRSELFGDAAIEDPSRISGKLYDLENDPEEMADVRKEKPDEWGRLIEFYRSKLNPLFDRSRYSVTMEMPRGPFAVAACSFVYGGNSSLRAAAGGNDLVATLKTTEDDDVWFMNPGWSNYYLLGKGAPTPVAFGFPIPSGEYDVTLTMAGAGSLKARGDDFWQPVSAGAFDPTSRYQATEDVELGTIQVTDHRFEVSVQVADDSPWLYIRMIGFKPVHDEAIEISDEERARLEALGYVGSKKKDK